MGWLYKKGVKPGNPWIDYQEKEKSSAADLVFVFKLEDFLYFILHEVCLNYPCDPRNNNTNLPLKFTCQIISTQNILTPKEIPINLISSPSEDFTTGALDEDSQNMRLAPVILNIPCDKGDNIIITVSGAPHSILFKCMIVGRKYEAIT
jgi:hypothetical protein